MLMQGRGHVEWRITNSTKLRKVEANLAKII